MPQPRKWFKLQDHVNDSAEIGTLNRVRAGDAGLGNRRPNKAGKFHSHCPYCLSLGIAVKLSEHHVLIECQSVGYERNQFKVPEHPINSPGSKYALRKFIGGDNAGATELHERARKIHRILTRWQDISA